MIKRKIHLFIALVFFCSLTTNVLGQNLDLTIDTLNLEYEGPLQEHEKIIIRSIYSFKAIYKDYESFNYRVSNFSNYPLVKSYRKRIEILVDEKLKLPRYATKSYYKTSDGENILQYSLVNGFNTFGNMYASAKEQISSYYMSVITHFVCDFKPYDFFSIIEKDFNKENSSILEKDLNDEKFSTLLSYALENGIKRAATDNGFYNKRLAKRLSLAILVRTIENLLNSKQEMTDRIIYLADTYCAFDLLKREVFGDEMFEKILKKYPSH